MGRSATVAAAAALLTGFAGCGGDGRHGTAPHSPPAPALSTGVRTGGLVPRATPADFRGPTARYRRHVRRELGAMLGDVARVRVAIAAGDRAAARRVWLAADEAYESIGAAYRAAGAAAPATGAPDHRTCSTRCRPAPPGRR